MSKSVKTLIKLSGIGAIILGIALSNNTGVLRNRLNLEQNVQGNTISAPDATVVDIPIHYSQLIDSNYFKTQKDSSYLLQ